MVMKSSFCKQTRFASFVRGSRRTPHWTLTFVTFFLCFVGCHSIRLLLDSDDNFSPNVTIVADETCLSDTVGGGTYSYYTLDIEQCTGSNFVNVLAWVTSDANAEWSLLVNTEGLVPEYDDDDLPSDGTSAIHIISEHKQPYALLTLPVPASVETSPSWYASVYTPVDTVDIIYKAWCSATNGCALNCSDPDTGPCVSVHTCRCIRHPDETSCSIDVFSLPGDNDLDLLQDGSSYIVHNQETLRPGGWKYLDFQVLENDSRILVEMSRLDGDVVLFLKPAGIGSGLAQLPTENDFNSSADVQSFQNRLSHHHIYTIASAETYYIGVYNNDVCMSNETYFNITVSIAAPNSTTSLCPLNCSHPNGSCIADNVCQCQPGFGGNFCEGSLWSAKPHNSVSGLLLPGDWAYVSVRHSELRAGGRALIKFTQSGGHPILMAKQGSYPTLTDCYLKFTDANLQPTASNTYQLDSNPLDDNNFIVAVFNVDYLVQGETQFEIVLLGGSKQLTIWIILVIAIGSSLFVAAAMASIRCIMQCQVSTTGNTTLDFEATPNPEGLDMQALRALPMVVFSEPTPPTDDSRCSICLAHYSSPEILCRIPTCGHIFHVACLDSWLQQHRSCPLCKLSVQNTIGVSLADSVTARSGATTSEAPSLTNSTIQFSSKSSDQTSSSDDTHSKELWQSSPSPITSSDSQPLLVTIDPKPSQVDASSVDTTR